MLSAFVIHCFFSCFFFFFFNDTATTEIYTLSLHDALPIRVDVAHPFEDPRTSWRLHITLDRKSTRLNSSHGSISYAVFCLKKKKKNKNHKLYTKNRQAAIEYRTGFGADCVS